LRRPEKKCRMWLFQKTLLSIGHWPKVIEVLSPDLTQRQSGLIEM
jgi:hypothetical protein